MDNLVSRRAVLDGIEDLKRSPWYQGDGYLVRKDAVEMVEQLCIKNLPSAQPERKKGKWIEKHHAYSDEENCIEEWQSAKCSVCGLYHTTPYMYYFSDYKFCPNCGADMRGEQE